MLGDGVASDVVKSVFEPGVNKGLVVFVYGIFTVLIVTLVAITLFIEFNIHVVMLTLLSAALFAAIRW